MAHDRAILHADMNCFYASVECFHRPELRTKPVVVGGSEESRHGIVLTKNGIAKKYGIKTGEALWEARKKCPDVVVVPPRYELYQRYSRLARALYYEYTDQVEPFGLDECWLDVSKSLPRWGGDPYFIAHEISERIKAELGVTVSIGVSWNKIFAKFGSDYKKPDAITRVTRENYRTLVWDAPVRELLYVGRATERKLNDAAIMTIGDLANASRTQLVNRLGKMGAILLAFARGEDTSPVKVLEPHRQSVDYEIKSVGNGLTAPRDLVAPEEVKALLTLLTESVAQRLRELRCRARGVAVQIRAGDLTGFVRQAPLPAPSCQTDELLASAWQLITASQPLDDEHPIRSLGIRAFGLEPLDTPHQLTLLVDEEKRIQRERLDFCIDEVRHRFGNRSVLRGAGLAEELFNPLDIKKDNVVHPVSFFTQSGEISS